MQFDQVAINALDEMKKIDRVVSRPIGSKTKWSIYRPDKKWTIK